MPVSPPTTASSPLGVHRVLEPAGAALPQASRALDARPEISQHLLRSLAQRLRRTNTAMADLIFSDVPGRVAKTLLDLGERFGQQTDAGLRVTHDLTQEEIAQLVGASRETVNKALATFAHRGWIRLEGKSVLIVDTEHLARRAR